jgi:outer membrane protein OmpA-like peptidoglycan-associated protein
VANALVSTDNLTMHALVTIAAVTLAYLNPDAGSFELHDTRDAGTAKSAHGASESKLQPTLTEALMKFFVIEKDKGPVKGIVICLTAPDGAKFYTEETDAEGYAETLVPVGKKYEVTYLALGRKDVAANVTVTDEPKQRVKLTLRFKRLPPPPPFVLKGVNFDTAKATIRPESHDLLDTVADFMKHKKKARIEISGHTDNVGKPKANKKLSADRAASCKAYLIDKGIAGDRMTTAGYGDERPIVPNDSDENRQKNRRIEVVEIREPSP